MHFNHLPMLGGWLALERDDYVTASGEYATAAERAPSDYMALNGWGWSLFLQSRFVEALPIFQESSRLNSNLQASIGTSICYCEVGSYEIAIRIATEAIQEYPGTIDPFFCLSYALRRNRNLDDGLDVLKRLAQLRPNNHCVYIELGKAYEDREEYNMAKESYEKALSLNPKSLDAMLSLGGFHLSQKDYQAAKEAFLNCLNDRPNWPDAHLGLGTAEMKLGNTASALLSLHLVVDTAPGMTQAYRFLFRIYFRQFRWRKAYAVCLKRADYLLEQNEHTKVFVLPQT